MRVSSWLAVAIAAGAAISGCVVEPARVRVGVPVVASGEIIVGTAPPAPVVETIVAPPGPAALFVWQPGYWHWDGRAYRWRGGHYARRPYAGAVWVPHAWVPRGGQWALAPGHWARP